MLCAALAAASARLLLAWSGVGPALAWRIEVSTAANSNLELREGLALFRLGVSPYSGSSCRTPPLALWLYGALADHDLLHVVPNTLLDLLTALLLFRLAHRLFRGPPSPAAAATATAAAAAEQVQPGPDDSPGCRTRGSYHSALPYALAWAYLLNPFTLAASAAGTTSSLECLAVVAALYGACARRPALAAASLAAASYMCIQAAVLLFPVGCLLAYGPEDVATPLNLLGRSWAAASGPDGGDGGDGRAPEGAGGKGVEEDWPGPVELDQQPAAGCDEEDAAAGQKQQQQRRRQHQRKARVGDGMTGKDGAAVEKGAKGAGAGSAATAAAAAATAAAEKRAKAAAGAGADVGVGAAVGTVQSTPPPPPPLPPPLLPWRELARCAALIALVLVLLAAASDLFLLCLPPPPGIEVPDGSGGGAAAGTIIGGGGPCVLGAMERLTALPLPPAAASGAAERLPEAGGAAASAAVARRLAAAGEALASCWAVRVYGSQVLLDDATPNVGQWWYLSMEVFEDTKAYLRLLAHSLLLALAPPLAMRLGVRRPLALFVVQLLCLGFLKPYPSVADLGLSAPLLLLLGRQQLAAARLRLLLPASLALLCVLGPAMQRMWLSYESANSNFFYSITLLYGVWQLVLLGQVLGLTLRLDRLARGKEGPEGHPRPPEGKGERAPSA